ncbi:unnamed protein product [Amoebophrya sp. A120]|nr:unnamed protein product [Amoebophrya sp. A120]|eukprot:GSA120T00020757001.1
MGPNITQKKPNFRMCGIFVRDAHVGHKQGNAFFVIYPEPIIDPMLLDMEEETALNKHDRVLQQDSLRSQNADQEDVEEDASSAASSSSSSTNLMEYHLEKRAKLLHGLLENPTQSTFLRRKMIFTFPEDLYSQMMRLRLFDRHLETRKEILKARAGEEKIMALQNEVNQHSGDQNGDEQIRRQNNKSVTELNEELEIADSGHRPWVLGVCEKDRPSKPVDLLSSGQNENLLARLQQDPEFRNRYPTALGAVPGCCNEKWVEYYLCPSTFSAVSLGNLFFSWFSHRGGIRGDWLCVLSHSGVKGDEARNASGSGKKNGGNNNKNAKLLFDSKVAPPGILNRPKVASKPLEVGEEVVPGTTTAVTTANKNNGENFDKKSTNGEQVVLENEIDKWLKEKFKLSSKEAKGVEDSEHTMDLQNLLRAERYSRQHL